MAWNEQLDHDHPSLAGMAQHDLIILGPQQMGLGRVDQGEKLDAAAVSRALVRRHALARLNPKAVLLAETRYFDAGENYFPPNSPLWRHDTAGERISSPGKIYGVRHVYLLNFAQSELQARVVAECKAYTESGVFDGCMFDWWNSAYSDTPGAEGTARLDLIQKVRAAVGNKVLLIGNINGSLPKMTASYLNGVYMEGFGTKGFSDWRQAVGNLTWLEAHLRPPAFTALEAWYDCGKCTGDLAKIQEQGRGSLPLMRESTTLSLTNSDGYVLFADPDALPTPDHLHDWYSFWGKTLGRPLGPEHVRSGDGSYRRSFDHGCAVFNPPNNHVVTVRFAVLHLSEASGTVALSHAVNDGDGDIFLLTDPGRVSETDRDPCASSAKQ